MAVIGSCEISNEKNDFIDALMGWKSVNKRTEDRGRSNVLGRFRKWKVLLGFFLFGVVVAITAYCIYIATSDVTGIRRRCIRDPKILNGKLTNVTGLNEGDTAFVECHDGHQVNASETVSCLHSGHWNETPVCLPMPCTKLHLPNHTKVDLRHLSHRMNKVNIACDHGYDLEGNKEVYCQDDGFWSEIPACKPVNCGLPSNIEKGIFLNLTETRYKNTFRVECIKGYILNGKKVIECESDGEWEDLPECNPVLCGTPTIPNHARIYDLEGVSFEHTVSYKCEHSYVLVGSNLSKCKSNGNWSTFPVCKRQCLEGITVTNGNVIKKNDLDNRDIWLEGDIAQIECNSGYKVNGSNVTECLPSGQWSERPSCVRRQCEIFETPNHVEITSAKQLFYYVNDEVTLSCFRGFRLSGRKSVKCQENGEWSTIPLCEPISCNKPQLESNMIIHNFAGVHYDSTFHVTCKHGYNLKGEETVRCGSDGNWIGRPKCEPVSCGYPTAQPNADMLYFSCMEFRCETSFGCKPGYYLNGDGKATCRVNGQWSSNYECVQIKEHPLPPRNNNNNNRNAKSGRQGNHSDVGISRMVALFVLTIIIHAFSK